MTAEYRRKIQTWIRSWEKKGYADGLPDEAPANLEEMGRVPSYRLLCVAIMKNDAQLQMLGYSRAPCQLYNDLKRVEIERRNKGEKLFPENKQSKLFCP